MSLPDEELSEAPLSKPQEDIASEPASPPSETPPRPIVVDAGGDLLLRVGAEADGREQEFFVCSKTLRRASSVWKSMLYGGFKEARPAEGAWVVSLPDDQAAPMLAILNIIHTRFILVPRKPALSEIYHILTLAHKYDMTGVVQPWADCWMEVADNAQGKEDGCSLAMLTYVAWEMGNEDLFTIMVNRLLLGSSVDDQGRLTTPDGICLENYDYLGPPDLLESADEILESVTELASSVNQVGSYMSGLDGHTKCNPREKIDKITRKTLRQRKVMLSASHIEYMRKQRQKTGIAGPFVWDPCWMKGEE
ncbi:hypothetical protein G7Z17_g6142 [Cylindrodendrum hubeiense]|uniref:BTB domain-containing protein n=1 Tax=Cylindrodendrum hubeiense TaxID=595255 RepID=A0A9P5LH53_9HYPO|nr:hypothetical protein G7Z17_g6142 [Cylindrodendrum hubeiense]